MMKIFEKKTSNKPSSKQTTDWNAEKTLANTFKEPKLCKLTIKKNCQKLPNIVQVTGVNRNKQQ